MNIQIPPQYNRWLEIDLSTIAENFRTMRAYLPKQIAIMAVVKADAYGLGAVPVANALERAGADAFAVTTLDEALELRQHGVKRPILVFSPVLPQEAPLFYEYDLTPTVVNLQGLEALRQAGAGKPMGCHLKLNTGMNRMGAMPDEAVKIVENALADVNGPYIAGVYSHFATALDQNTSFSQKQLQIFNLALERLRQAGLYDFTAHIANSPGCLRFPEARFSMVRLGSILYGQTPLAAKFGLQLKDPFVAKARIVNLQRVSKGDSVGYGRDFIAKRNMELAVLPIGYADGFAMTVQARPMKAKKVFQDMSRNMGKVVLGRADKVVYWGASPLPVVGRVAMQSMVVDVSGVGAKLGQTASIPLRRLAAGSRLPRFYLEDGVLKEARTVLTPQQAEQRQEA